MSAMIPVYVLVEMRNDKAKGESLREKDLGGVGVCEDEGDLSGLPCYL
jgi:hypothetical protein